MKPILSLLLIVTYNLCGQTTNQLAETNILHYNCDIEPDISRKSIQGRVTITFNIVSVGTKLSFDCGNLVIESVQIKGKELPFNVKENKLSLDVSDLPETKQPYEVEIHYHGSPTRGINFFPELEQVYTVFSTSQWLVCKDSPDDKATLSMRITCPSHLKVVGCGELIKKTTLKENKVLVEWNQSKAFPTYTFGFAVGPYNENTDSIGKFRPTGTSLFIIGLFINGIESDIY